MIVLIARLCLTSTFTHAFGSGRLNGDSPGDVLRRVQQRAVPFEGVSRHQRQRQRVHPSSVRVYLHRNLLKTNNITNPRSRGGANMELRGRGKRTGTCLQAQLRLSWSHLQYSPGLDLTLLDVHVYVRTNSNLYLEHVVEPARAAEVDLVEVADVVVRSLVLAHAFHRVSQET